MFASSSCLPFLGGDAARWMDAESVCAKIPFQIAKQGRRVDIMHYHHAWNGFYSGTWDEAKVKYSKIMSDQEDVNYVTVLREPVAHYLSYYYYFLNPINKVRARACVEKVRV